MRRSGAGLGRSLSVAAMAMAATAALAFETADEAAQSPSRLTFPAFLTQQGFAELYAAHAALSGQGAAIEPQAPPAVVANVALAQPDAANGVRARAEELSRRFQPAVQTAAVAPAGEEQRKNWEADALRAAGEIAKQAPTAEAPTPEPAVPVKSRKAAGKKPQKPAAPKPDAFSPNATDAVKATASSQAAPTTRPAKATKPSVAKTAQRLGRAVNEEGADPAARNGVDSAAAVPAWKAKVHSSEVGPFGWSGDPG